MFELLETQRLALWTSFSEGNKEQISHTAISSTLQEPLSGNDGTFERPIRAVFQKLIVDSSYRCDRCRTTTPVCVMEVRSGWSVERSALEF
jgi:hypothetical protein